MAASMPAKALSDSRKPSSLHCAAADRTLHLVVLIRRGSRSRVGVGLAELRILTVVHKKDAALRLQTLSDFGRTKLRDSLSLRCFRPLAEIVVIHVKERDQVRRFTDTAGEIQCFIVVRDADK